MSQETPPKPGEEIEIDGDLYRVHNCYRTEMVAAQVARARKGRIWRRVRGSWCVLVPVPPQVPDYFFR